MEVLLHFTDKYRPGWLCSVIHPMEGKKKEVWLERLIQTHMPFFILVYSSATTTFAFDQRLSPHQQLGVTSPRCCPRPLHGQRWASWVIAPCSVFFRQTSPAGGDTGSRVTVGDSPVTPGRTSLSNSFHEDKFVSAPQREVRSRQSDSGCFSLAAPTLTPKCESVFMHWKCFHCSYTWIHFKNMMVSKTFCQSFHSNF